MHRMRLLTLVALIVLLIPAGLGAVRAAHAAAPSIALSPSGIPAGATTIVTVSGTGFTPNNAVSLRLDSNVLSQAVPTNGAGAFSQGMAINASSVSAGAHVLIATDAATHLTASRPLYVVKLTLSATSGAAGSQVTLTGQGFPPTTAITVSMGGQSLAAGFSTDTFGSFSKAVSVPALPAGTQQIIVQTAQSGASAPFSATVPFTITGARAATITLSPSAVNAGGTFTLSGTGFPANIPLTVKVDNIPLTYTLVASAGGALAATTFTAPSGLSAGAHTVTVAATSDQGRVLAGATLTVTGPTAASLTATPTTVQAGGQVTLTGAGFGANELVTLTAAGLTIPTIQASAQGTFSAHLAIPATESVAALHVTATGQQTHRAASVTLTIQRSSAAISLSAGAVRTNGSFQVSGNGFMPGEQVVLAIAGRAVATIAANNQGAFTNVTLTVPAGMSGAVSVSATGQSSHRVAGAPLTVTAPVAASISISPGAFAAGIGIHITGVGFGPHEKVALSLNGGAPFATAITGSNGAFAITLALPTSVPAGSARVTATGLNSHIAAGATVQITGAAPAPAPVPNPGPITAGSTTWYYAAGRTDSGFGEQIAVLNPNGSAVQGTITLFYGADQTHTQRFTLGAHARGTYDVGRMIGQTPVVAAIVQANLPIAAARTTQRGNEDVMSTTGVSAPNKSWYFAEGYTSLTFEESLHLLNPGNAVAHVHLTWPLFNGRPAVTHDVTMAPRSAMSIPVNQYVIKASHATIVTSDQPIVASRTILFGDRHQGADSKAGATEAHTTLLFAEGSTNNGFEEYLTILNPSATQAAQVTANFYDRQGHLLGTKIIIVDPMHRGNIKVNDVVRNTAIATRLQSTLPIVAERALYFGAPNGGSAGGTVVFGRATPEKGWAFATGDTRPGHSEFELLFNPNATSSTIQAIYYADNGQVVQKTFTLPANTRMNIDVTQAAPGLARGYHGVILRTLNGVSFLAEQALYTSNGYSSIGFGSATVGTPIA